MHKRLAVLVVLLGLALGASAAYAAAKSYYSGKTTRGDRAQITMVGEKVTDGVIWAREECSVTGGAWKANPYASVAPVLKVTLKDGKASGYRRSVRKDPPETRQTWFTVRRLADGKLAGTIRVLWVGDHGRINCKDQAAFTVAPHTLGGR